MKEKEIKEGKKEGKRTAVSGKEKKSEGSNK